LHPCNKLAYFKNAGWQIEWIETAGGLVEEELKRTYADFKGTNVDSDLDEEDLDSGDEVKIVSGPLTKLSWKPTDKNTFGDLFLAPPSAHHTTVNDKLVVYLSTPVENIQDAVKWWYAHQKEY
ncbi:hypothetical protein DXG01_004556, partial [Tephrocybe rancida]